MRLPRGWRDEACASTRDRRLRGKQENVGEQGGSNGISVAQERPTGDGGDQQGDGADEDEALVGCGIGTEPKCRRDESGKDEHVGERDDVEETGIASGRACLADERIGGGENTEDHHKTCETETGDAETAVDLYAAGGDERSLGDEQENPAGECRTVDVDDQTGQGRMKNSREIVGAGESQENRGQHEHGHRRKEEWSKRRPGKALTGFEGAAGCRVMVDIVAPELNFLLADDTRGSWNHCMPRRSVAAAEDTSAATELRRVGSGCGATPREPRKKDQHQTVEEERDDHGGGVAEAEIFEEKFQCADGDGSVGDPSEFDAMPA